MWSNIINISHLDYHTVHLNSITRYDLINKVATHCQHIYFSTVYNWTIRWFNVYLSYANISSDLLLISQDYIILECNRYIFHTFMDDCLWLYKYINIYIYINLVIVPDTADIIYISELPKLCSQNFIPNGKFRSYQSTNTKMPSFSAVSLNCRWS